MDVKQLYVHLGSNYFLGQSRHVDLCEVLPRCADYRQGCWIPEGRLTAMQKWIKRANSLLQDYCCRLFFCLVDKTC
ncbi:hypothetical protein DPMN_031915 [Dreissena polymorpha]|uniref:Uncharacterized protein n=1 Tax=Dreissena polymorpha TaxID=45954 RepID=A0A9D4M1W8_DREPO|nr:hypothetical protein DPMN_031915 [Dreissena polymorpha]